MESRVSIIFYTPDFCLLVLDDSVIGLTILVSSRNIYQMHVQGFILVVVGQLEEGSIVGKDEEKLILFLQRP